MAVFYSDIIHCAYGASKPSIVQLTKYIAIQNVKNKIPCKSVALGLILTLAAKDNMSNHFLDIFAKYDESKFITGQTIKVEGGHYLLGHANFNMYFLTFMSTEFT